MKRVLLFLLLALPFWASAQITATNSSFSNGSNKGTDGTFSLTSLVGSSGLLLSNDPTPSLQLFLDSQVLTRLDSIPLGEIFLGNSLTRNFTLKNVGGGILFYHVLAKKAAAAKDSNPFSFIGLPTYDTLAPGDSLQFQASFTPSSRGQSGYQLYIDSNDPERPSQILLVYANGLQPKPILVDASPREGFEGATVSISGLFLQDDLVRVFFGDSSYVVRRVAMAAAAAPRDQAARAPVDTDGDGIDDSIDGDDDGDGILDVNDNCSLVSNSDQANQDGDPLGNVCDCQPSNSLAWCTGQAFYSTIGVITPMGAQSGPIRIKTSGGEDTTSFNFTVLRRPVVNSTLASIVFDNNGAATIAVNPGNGQSRLLVYQPDSEVTLQPVDGQNYVGVQADGSVGVISATNTFTISGLQANGVYHFKVFEFSGGVGIQQYLTVGVNAYSFVVPPFISAPTTAASNIIFSDVTNNSMKIAFTPGNGEKRVVLMKEVQKQQMDLPVTFDDPNVNYKLIGFGGAEASTIVNDPTSPFNKVAKVIRTATAQSWAGTLISTNNGEGFSRKIPFTATEKKIKVRVWSPAAGINIRLKVEDHLDPARSVETEAITTVANTWETLNFDFGNQAFSTAPLNLNYNYDKAAIFFNFGVNGATTGERIYYFDDIQFNGSTPGAAPSPGAAPAPVAAVIIADGIELSGSLNFTQATEYQPGWKVMYVGIDATVDVTGLRGDYDYQVTVVEYNGSSSGTKYLNSGTPSATQRTLPDVPVPEVLAPTVASSAITFSSVLSASMQVNFTPGNGSKRVVLMKEMPKQAASTQLDLPVTFDDPNVNYRLIGFGGAEASTIVSDSTSPSNKVAKVVKTNTAEPWAGTTISTNNGEGFSRKILFTANEKKFKIRVWSPDAGIKIRLKIDDHLNPAISVETEATTTVANAWETVTFDFANQASGTAPLNLNYNYDKATIFFNFGVSGATAGERTYYFDDVQFEGATVARTDNVNDSVIIADGIDLNGNPNFSQATEYLPGWKVIYVGSDASVSVTGLRGDYDYKVTVVEYNGSGARTKYLNSGAPSAAQRTLPDVLAPTVAASNIAFTNVSSTSMQVNFASGNGEQRVAILKTGTPPVFLPGDDAFYSGDLGDGEQVVYNGNGNSFILSQLLPDTEYFVTLYEFNTDSTLTKYLSAGAPVASQRTLALPLVYITSPANGAINQNVRLNLTALAVSGATNYTIQVSTDPTFAIYKTKSGGRTLLFDSLLYNQTYYTRVKTDLRPDYGKLTTFTTASPEFFSFVTSPANNATNIALSLNVTANLVQLAATYTIELNTDPLFGTATAITRSGGRTLAFSNLSFSTTYYSRVKTELSPNWGATRQFTTGNALALSYIVSPANNATNVSWMPTVIANTIPGATTYTIQLCASIDFLSSPIIEMAGTSTSYLFLGLAYNTKYYARVSTDLTAENFGPVRSFTTGNPINYSYVSSPANLAVGTNTSLNITSNAVPGAFTYRIQLSEDPNFNTVDFDVTGNNRTLAFSGLKFLTKYYNRVQTDLDPGFGAVRSFTTADPTALAYVTAPGNTAINQNTVLNITSNTVGGASLYIIQLSETSDFATVAFEVSGPTRTLAFSGLKYNTTYYNRVGTDLTTLFGQVRSFTTRTAESIAFVTSPANSSINASTVLNITSNNVPGATNYTIQLSETSDFSVIAFEVSSPTRTVPFSGLKYNTTYYNRVLTDQSTTYGQVRSFSTRTAESLAFVTSPANNAVNVNNTTLNVVSNIVPGATTYTIQLSESADFATIAAEASSASNTMAFAGLKYNTTYFNRVLTNLSGPTGQVRSFTTRTAESLAYVTTPVNNATNVNNTSVNVTSNLVPGATNYLIQLSELPDFSSIAFQANGTGRTYTFTGLNYNTRYYNRVLTDQSALYGPVRSFTTRTAESLAFVTNPTNGASNILTTPSLTSNTVPGASTYTIQLSRLLDFSTVDFEVTGNTRTLAFTGLLNGTTYFNRVRTNLSTEFGVVRSFTTMGTPTTLRIAINPEPEKALNELKEFEMRVFPNPFREKVSIFVESIYPEVELTLSDMTGRVVHKSTETTNKSIVIERHLAVGVYLLRAISNGRSEMVRVVKIE